MTSVGDDFGWYADLESKDGISSYSENSIRQDIPDDRYFNSHGKLILRKVLSLPNPVTEPPLYVLGSSLSFQQLWYQTAGRRPRQPKSERMYYEKLWEKNFQLSCACSSNENDFKVKNHIEKFTHSKNSSPSYVFFHGKGPHSTAVSKSFINYNFLTITVQMPYFRVLVDSHNKKYAEFLVVVLLGNNKFGIWKRYSDFKQLFKKILEMNAHPDTMDSYHNTLLSWDCVVQRQRWFRCLDQVNLADISFRSIIFSN